MAKKRKRKRPAPNDGEVPLSAMIDIVFLLLIYFVWTFSSTPTEAHIAINMPAPSSQPGPPPPVMFEVWVLDDGTYLYQGVRNETLEQLDTRLQRLAITPDSSGGQQKVIVKVHQYAHEEYLVRLLDLCAKHKLTELNVLMLRDSIK